MSRTLISTLAVFGSALALLLGGCGGGGGGGGGSNGGNEGSGLVRSISGLPLTGATVKFYASGSSTVLASGTIGADGRLPATIPANATRFSVDASAIDDSVGTDQYWTSYGYAGTYFDDTSSCYAALPVAGSTRGFVNDIVFLPRTSPPPPPVFGCVG